MAFVSHIPVVGVQHPQQIQIQYPTIAQQPVIPFVSQPFVPQPQFLLQPQVQVYQPPMSIMMPTMVTHPPFFTPPYFIMVPAQRSSYSFIQRAHIADCLLRPPIRRRLYSPMCLSSTMYRDSSLPSRDSLLTEIAICAGHHGLSIRHPGGRIDPFRVKLYVLPKSNGSRGLLSGIDFEHGIGLVVPGDVIRVVRLGGIEEKGWEEALKEIQKEKYEAVVAVDMGDGGLNSSTTTTTAIVPTPDTAMDGDQTAVAAAA